MAIQKRVRRGDIEAARVGLEALREALSRSEQGHCGSINPVNGAYSEVENSAVGGTRSWVSTIVQARHAIEDIQLEIPSLNRILSRRFGIIVWNESDGKS